MVDAVAAITFHRLVGDKRPDPAKQEDVGHADDRAGKPKAFEMDDRLFANLDAGGRPDDHQQPEFVVDLPEISVFQRCDHGGTEHEREAAADGHTRWIPHDQQRRGDKEGATHPEEAKQHADQEAEPDEQPDHRHTEPE